MCLSFPIWNSNDGDFLTLFRELKEHRQVPGTTYEAHLCSSFTPDSLAPTVFGALGPQSSQAFETYKHDFPHEWEAPCRLGVGWGLLANFKTRGGGWVGDGGRC